MVDRSLPTVSDCMSSVSVRFREVEDVLLAMDRLCELKLSAAPVT